ncbi:MAG: phosphoenolpyruvate--protein phosphotransferase [Treponema sp.]|nr:phosphoenolpyruvate--protein phosphotransferase [Treponema sp.]
MVITGKGVAPGAAVGSIYIYNEKYSRPAESFVPAGKEQSQLDRYLTVKKEALDELEEVRLSMQKVDPGKAEIFNAHKEIVDDIIINEEIPARILNERWAGDWAIYQVYETVLGVLKKTPDPLISERAADFDDVRSLLLRLWYGRKKEELSALTQPVIIAAEELMPSDVASMDKEKVLAILLEAGGATSHTTIIAKSYGIPTIMGIQGLLGSVKHGQLAAVNADEGTVILDPKDDVVSEYIKKSEIFNKDKQETKTFLDTEGCTNCGVKIDIGLNINSVNNEELDASEYTDSVGVFRTEFIFMNRDTLPTEEEQFLIYKIALERYGERPVILRTLDIGGDKSLTSMELPREDNPFLGNRALRFCFSRPDIFKTQIRAALRASYYGNLWLMLPMVSSLEDIRKAKQIITCTKAELDKEKKPLKDFKTGIMIEIPSIALIAELAANEVDFASIGSNDLCQYLCAADRMNSAVEPYYQSFHPAMFRLIKETITAFNSAGKPISICGELGADPAAIPLLIGLGLRKISMGAASVAAAKRAIASVTVEKAEEIARNVLGLSTAQEIEKYLAL